MRYAVIRLGDKMVRNVVEIEDEADWQAPDGFVTLASDHLNIGDIYEGEL